MTMRLTVVGAVLFLWASTLPSRGEHQTTTSQISATTVGTAQLGGVVMSAEAPNQPIRRAYVLITAPELRGSRYLATDDRGRFLFTGLPAGRYQLDVNKPGYLAFAYGQKRWRGGGTAIPLADGQKELALRIPLPKGAVITGRVTDEFGQPISGALVDVSEMTTVDGQLTLSRASRSGQTDDRGVYRVYGLPPGTFYVSALGLGQAPFAADPTNAADLQWALSQSSSGNAIGSSPPPVRQSVAFTPVFHPSVFDASAAAPVEVAAGAERSGVDITVRFVPVVRITGTVSTPDGRAVPGVSVSLISDATGPVSPFTSPTQRATSATDGGFAFERVKGGQYTVIAQSLIPAATGGRGVRAPDMWGAAVIRAEGRDMLGVAITLQPGMTVRGRIVLAADAAAAANAPPLQVGIRAVPRPGSAFAEVNPTLQAVPDADGAFTLAGVAPGWYRLFARSGTPGPGLPPAWMMKSSAIQDQDVGERPFEIRPGGSIDGVRITITDKIASLSGRLVDAQGKPAPEYSVVLFSMDRALWLRTLMASPKTARPANDGTYRFDGLPPGEYYLAAATDVDVANLYTASYLEQFIPAAVKLTIAEGEKKIQDLKIGGGS